MPNLVTVQLKNQLLKKLSHRVLRSSITQMFSKPSIMVVVSITSCLIFFNNAHAKLVVIQDDSGVDSTIEKVVIVPILDRKKMPSHKLISSKVLQQKANEVNSLSEQMSKHQKQLMTLTNEVLQMQSKQIKKNNARDKKKTITTKLIID